MTGHADAAAFDDLVDRSQIEIGAWTATAYESPPAGGSPSIPATVWAARNAKTPVGPLRGCAVADLTVVLVGGYEAGQQRRWAGEAWMWADERRGVEHLLSTIGVYGPHGKHWPDHQSAIRAMTALLFDEPESRLFQIRRGR